MPLYSQLHNYVQNLVRIALNGPGFLDLLPLSPRFSPCMSPFSAAPPSPTTTTTTTATTNNNIVMRQQQQQQQQHSFEAALSPSWLPTTPSLLNNNAFQQQQQQTTAGDDSDKFSPLSPSSPAIHRFDTSGSQHQFSPQSASRYVTMNVISFIVSYSSSF